MTKQVVICDDELHIVAAAGFRLRSGGYDVVGASDGVEAWELIQDNVPDLLITDYCMPRLDGLALCQKIRDCEQTHGLPIFLLTAKNLNGELLKRAEEFGVLELITKPFSPRDLLRRVDRVLERHSSTESCSRG